MDRWKEVRISIGTEIWILEERDSSRKCIQRIPRCTQTNSIRIWNIVGWLLRINKPRRKSDWPTELTFHVAGPILCAPYQAGWTVSNFKRKEIEKMLATNVIERKQTEWAALIVFLSEKIGLFLICIIFREMNSVNAPDFPQNPGMDECKDFLGDAEILWLMMNLDNGYWKSLIAGNARDRTDSMPHHGLLVPSKAVRVLKKWKYCTSRLRKRGNLKVWTTHITCGRSSRTSTNYWLHIWI